MTDQKRKQRILLGRMRRLAKRFNFTLRLRPHGDRAVEFVSWDIRPTELQKPRPGSPISRIRTAMSGLCRLLDEFGFGGILLPTSMQEVEFFDWYQFRSDPDSGVMTRECRRDVEARWQELERKRRG